MEKTACCLSDPWTLENPEALNPAHSYVLEKTAYSLVKPEDLSAQLQAVGLLPSHVSPFRGPRLVQGVGLQAFLD
jgi:hypothetical protein